MSWIGRILVGVVVLALVGLGAVWLIGIGTFGQGVGPGTITGPSRTPADVAGRFAAEREAAEGIGVAEPKQILFGDLHVHSTFSLDAFLMSLPMMGGQGVHPVADACDFARYCSELDFWSINDHALSLTAQRWGETVESLRECQSVAGAGDQPDLVSFLGWEWTQMGTNPDNHYGHKNVIFRGLGDDAIPTRPIFATPPAAAIDRQMDNPAAGPLAMGAVGLLLGQQGYDFARFMRETLDEPPCPADVPVRDLPKDCREGAATPGDLFAKLDDWGHDALVIPHGTSWGMYTPQGSSWQKQATTAQHDPRWQRLVEVYSGHGNSEEFRDWSAVEIASDGAKSCPAPTDSYLPSCWRAGEIIHQRCLDAGESGEECDRRAADARQNYVDADISGHLTVPGAQIEEWLDSGQCQDCFQPAFNTRPKSSVQYMMAVGGFEDPEDPVRLRFGFLASSDVHSSRPGTGYKEYDRREMTEARLGATTDTPLGGRDTRPAEPRSVPFDPLTSEFQFFARNESERAASFFVTGGLVAVHADGRDRDAVWNGLHRREVYGTSGPRILLWFDLLNGPDGGVAPMGSEVELSDPPAFEVRAVGSFEQKPGCSDAAKEALGEERLQWLCGGECLHPSDQRRRISRIEVVRIRPQQHAGEPVAPLIEDPWLTHACPPSREGCRFVFTDPEFGSSGRDAVYYVRAIEEPSPAINVNNLRCSRGEDGACLEVNPCDPQPYDAECLAETEQRAWSSPIFVDHAGGML